MKKILLSIIIALSLGSSVAYADTLGQQQTFNVSTDYDQSGRPSITATLRHVSDHAYIYVEDAVWATFTSAGQKLFLEDAKTLANEFDTKIWSRERDFFGFEPDPGIDKDSRLVILLESLRRGNGGYFDPVHSYPRTQFSESNERDMITLSIESLRTPYAKSFLAHEFQHLISLNQKEINRGLSEDTWLNELRAEYAITIAGYNTPYANSGLENRVQTFLRVPSDSLTEWPNVAQDYASVALFAQYLAGRYGQNILRETLLSAEHGIPSLNAYFASRQLPDRFADVFADWMIANVINDGSLRYGYANPDLRSIRVQPLYQNTLRSDSNYVISSSIKDWQPVWQEFPVGENNVGPDRAVRLEFQSDPNHSFLVSYAIFYADGSYDVERVTLNQGRRTVYLMNEGMSISRVLVALTKTTKIEGFGAWEPEALITTSASLASQESAQAAMGDSSVTFNSRAQVLRDGALIKRNNGEPETYVIWGTYKRYLSPEVMKLYGHLDPASAIPVNDATFNSYTTSNYVRALDTKPVYAIWPDNTKHWFNITVAQWDATRRDWNAIFTINDLELNFYRTGVDITR